MVAPIIIWQLKKEEMPGLDAHGKAVANWIITLLIYGGVSALPIFVLIGIPLILLLCLVRTIFPIIGGIKAGDGEVWNYPMSITFFR